MRTRILGFAGFVLAFASSGVSAATINFDGIADGTVINNYYSGVGVTFNNPLGVSADNQYSPNIYARAFTLNASAPNVVSVFAAGVPGFDARWGAVEAVFSQGQQQVSIDASFFLPPEVLTNPANYPKLEIYNTSNQFVTSVPFDVSVLACSKCEPTSFQTLTYQSGAANIGKIRLLSGQPGGSPSRYGVFDNLSYSAVPVPAAAWLMPTAFGLVAPYLRRRKVA